MLGFYRYLIYKELTQQKENLNVCTIYRRD